jgi:hypothetical protein
MPGKQQDPRLRRIMAKEVSKSVYKGIHKNGGSIREMLIKSSAVNQTYAEMQSKKRKEAIERLFSAEGAMAALEEQMAIKHHPYN